MCRGFFWWTDQRLPGTGAAAEPDRWPDVTVVVPARDEAEVLPLSLPSLLAQDYPGRADVVLVDDGSTDGTGSTARALAERAGPRGAAADRGVAGAARGGLDGQAVGRTARDRGGARWRCGGAGPAGGRLPPLPAGVRSRGGPAEFLLLTDADIAHAPDSLRRLVAAAVAHDLDLVSQMARLRVANAWGAAGRAGLRLLLRPALPVPVGEPARGSHRAPRQAAASCCGRRRPGGRGFRTRSGARCIDDVALAGAVRRHADLAGPLPSGWTASGRTARLADLWDMVARSAYAQLRHSVLLLAAAVAGIACVYLAPPLCLAAGLAGGDRVAAWAGGAAWAVMAGTYVPMLRHYRQPLWSAVLLPVTALLYLCMTVDSAVRHHRGGAPPGRSRTYPRPQAAPDS